MNYLSSIGLGLVLTGTAAAASSSGPLPRSSPEAQGVASPALLSFVNALDHQIPGMHSVMVVRHGHVIAAGWWAPYDSTHNHVLYSLSKSFTSTAVGFAVAEGKLSLDDPVLKFFPADAPPNPSDHLKEMRVRDLLTMSTGQQTEPPVAPEIISPKTFLAHPVPHKPGTYFMYDTAATFMLSAIVQKVTGQTVFDYLRPRLFVPLGITHPVWDTNFQGISLGGYGLRVRTEDIAKLGLLYLHRGRWHGRQLLLAKWVAMATSKQVSNGNNPQSDWNQGYGFQFWRCRHDAFRGDGAFGQYCLVMPDQDAVVAITSGVKDMQAVLNVIWDKLLPTFQAQPLPANPSADRQLEARLARLQVRPAQGAATSPHAGTILNRTFVFPTNSQKIKSLKLVSSDSGHAVTLVMQMDGKSVEVPCSYHHWGKGHAPFLGGPLAHFPDEPTAGTFAWSDDDTCVIKLCAYETPFQTTLTLHFAGNHLTLDSEVNVAFGPTKRPQLTGRAQE